MRQGVTQITFIVKRLVLAYRSSEVNSEQLRKLFGAGNNFKRICKLITQFRIDHSLSIVVCNFVPHLVLQPRKLVINRLATRPKAIFRTLLFFTLSLSLGLAESADCPHKCGEGPIRVYLPSDNEYSGYGYTALEACKNLYRAYGNDAPNIAYSISAAGANNCWFNAANGCDLHSSPPDGWIKGPVCIVDFDPNWWKDVFKVSGAYYDDMDCELTSNGTNPINSASGNKFETETDLSGHLGFVRYYNSLSIQKGSLGIGWTHSHDYSLFLSLDNPQKAFAYRPNGKVYEFTLEQNSWNPINNKKLTLQASGDGWQLRGGKNIVETYNASGLLSEIVDGQGTKRYYKYDNDKRLSNVSDSLGNQLILTYDTENRVATLTDQAGNLYRYSYTASNDLASVTYPDNTPDDHSDNPKRQYLYEDSRFPHSLTGIINENGIQSAKWTYDEHGRATSSEHENGSEHTTLTYNADGSTTATNALGKQTTYHIAIINGTYKVSQVEGHPTALCAGANQNYTYDGNGFLTSKTDWNGNLTTYIRNLRGLETSRTEASGTPVARTITTEWHPDFDKPVRIAEPDRVIEFNYDDQGRQVSKIERAAP